MFTCKIISARTHTHTHTHTHRYIYCNVNDCSFWSCLSKSKQDQTIFETALLSDRGCMFGFAALQHLLFINICPLGGEKEKKGGIQKQRGGSRDLSFLINHHSALSKKLVITELPAAAFFLRAGQTARHIMSRVTF